MHEGYEQKYQQLKADKDYDKILKGHEKRENVLKLEVEEHRNIAKLL